MISRHLVNATNLHSGGGVQVAASFIHEISLLSDYASRVTIAASTEVTNNLSALGTDISKFISFKTIDTRGFNLFNKSLYSYFDKFDVVFTVFGPLYRFNSKYKSIVGFAQPWIIYPDNDCYRGLTLLNKLRTKVKYLIQGWYFRRADDLIVELSHVRTGLISQIGIDPERIHIVNNCLSSIFHTPKIWQPFSLPTVDCDLLLGFLGRNYLHKNTAIFPDIANALIKNHGIKSKFLVTFTDSEWHACSPAFRQICINVGPLTVAQCPLFYQALDAVVFPSLLECFSATPLEAMAMEKPLFASDKPFNRDVCLHHAHYFNPLSPESAAAVIASVFEKGGSDYAALSAARDHAFNFSNSKDRARRYLSFLFKESLI